LGEDEELMLWRDVLDEVAAGRTQALRCPVCNEGQVVVERDQRRTRLECRACRRFIEGRMADE
jgi:hypothetical protein